MDALVRGIRHSLGESFTYCVKLSTLFLARRGCDMCVPSVRVSCVATGQRIVEWGHCSPVVSSDLQLNGNILASRP